MQRALVIVDIQNDYSPGGANPLDGPEDAAANAARLLQRFRDDGDRVVHLQHVWDEPDATFMRPGPPGAEIHDRGTRTAGEPFLQKPFHHGSAGTSLEARVLAAGA